MSLKYIPGCIWWSLTSFIVVLSCLLGVFTIFLYKAKHVEIQLAQVKIAADYVDHYSNQVNEIINTLQATLSDVELGHKHAQVGKVEKGLSYASPSQDVLMSTKLILDKKQKELQVVDKNLQTIKAQLQQNN